MATFSTALVPDALKVAVREARKKQTVDAVTFNAMDFRSKLTSFTVAGDVTNSSIGKINRMINSAIIRGDSYLDFQKALSKKLLTRITSPKVVWANSVNNAYHRARHQTSNDLKSTRPFLQYVTFGDDRVRPNHAAMDGRIAKQNSAFWDRNYPPNGHQCRCTARPLSQTGVKRRGGEVQTDTQIKASAKKEGKAVPIPDKGWAGRPQLGEPVNRRNVKKLTEFPKDNMESLLRIIAKGLKGAGGEFADYQEKTIEDQLAEDMKIGKSFLKSMFERTDLHLKIEQDRASMPDSDFYQSYTKKKILGDKSLVIKVDIGAALVKKPLIVFRDFMVNTLNNSNTYVEYFMNFLDGKLVVMRVQRNIMAKLDIFDKVSGITETISGLIAFQKAA